jgi:fatty acid desaturase
MTDLLSSRPVNEPASRASSAQEMTPDALEQHRFERDRVQALRVVAVLAFPIAAFGIIDAMVAKSGIRLAILWSVRGATLLALAALWHWLRAAPTRTRFERLLFNAQLVGVALAIASHIGRGPDQLFITRFELLSVVVYYLMIPGRTRLQAVPAIVLSVASLALVLYWHHDVSGPQIVTHVVCFALANALGLLVAHHRQATAEAEDRAWRAMVRARDHLQETVAELRALRGAVPICPQCHKVRDERNAWQQLEAYVASRGDVGFSAILCPSCLTSAYGAVLSGDTPAR